MKGAGQVKGAGEVKGAGGRESDEGGRREGCNWGEGK